MSLMYAQMGMKVVDALSAHGQAKHKVRMEEIMRDYQQTMSDISAAQQLNTMTANEISARDASIRAASALDIQSLQDRAGAEVEAAAAGVAGGSVRNTMRGLTRSRLMAKKAMHDKVQAQKRSFTQDRRNVALARVMNKDVSVIPKPSAASALLGLGASMIDIYDSHQPDGQKIEDTIARWGR